MSSRYVKGWGVALAIALGGTQAQSAEPALGAKFRMVQEHVPGQYVVVLREEAVPGLETLVGEKRLAATRAVAQKLGDKHGARLHHVYAHALVGFSARLSEAEARRLSEDERVAYVEEDVVVKPTAERSTSIIAPPSSTTISVWGLDRIDQSSSSLDSLYHYGARGTGVHAYVLDTGTDAHLDFSGRLGQGFNAVGDEGGTQDCGNLGTSTGHGTHVTGTLGGDTLGVAPGVTLHPVRVFPCTTASASDVIAGVDWVASHAIKPAVANMSLGGPTSSSLDSAVDGLIDEGVIVVVAAGNNSGDACDRSPARVPRAITVGATTSSDAVASFSNQGSCVDLFAPGVAIPSARNGTATEVWSMSGTSMAAPHVSGAAALYLQTHRTATPTQVRDVLVDHATTGAITGLTSGSPDNLLNTGDLDSWLVNVATPLHTTDDSWAFDTADWNNDNVDDVVGIKRVGTSNQTEVHILDGASGFIQFGSQRVTALHVTNTDWDFEVADWNGDGVQDLFAINRKGLNHTEVHVLDGATSLTSYLGHYSTVFGQTDANWEFDVGDWNHDGTPDLLSIRRAGGPSGNVEVDIVNGADGFSTVLQHSVTAIPQTGTQFDFNLVDWNWDNTLDLVATLRNGLSNSTEMHVLSGATGFSDFILQTGTALHQTDGTWVFKLAQRDETFLHRIFGGGNGFDLVGIKRSSAESGQTEVHILNP